MSARFEENGNSAASRTSVLRIAVVTALSASVLYIICWLGAVIGLVPVTHRYLQLFSRADQTSVTALVEGVVSSMAFGFLAGVIFAAIYKSFAFLDRR